MVEKKIKTVKKKSNTKVRSLATKKITKKVEIKNTNQNLIFSVILGLFIVISAFQSFQISDLKSQIQDGGVKISSSNSNSYSSSSGNSQNSANSAVPSNIDNLPQMVGGC